MPFVVFDLDQTLIRGEDVDWALWLASCEEALQIHIPNDQDWSACPVHTDHGLLESLAHRYCGAPLTARQRETYDRVLFERLDSALKDNPRLLAQVEGAAAMLEGLDFPAGLATGNLHWATLRKLASAGLDRFALPCACSEDAPDRPALVRRCLEAIGWQRGQPAVSVGDGVWDVEAARALGIGFVGVGTTPKVAERLRRAGARVVVENYLDIDAFRVALVQATVPGPPHLRTAEGGR